MKSFEEIKDILFRFIYDKMSIKEFEEWIYSNEDLESILGKSMYLEFLEYDYKDSLKIKDKVKETIELFTKAWYVQVSTIWLLENIVKNIDLIFCFKELIDSGVLIKYNLLYDDLLFYYNELEKGNVHRQEIISEAKKILASKKILDFDNYEF